MVMGYRKLVMVALMGAITAVVPEVTGKDLTTNQTNVLQTLILSAFSGNAVEHLVDGFKHAIGVRNSNRAIHAVRPVSNPEQAPAGDRH